MAGRSAMVCAVMVATIGLGAEVALAQQPAPLSAADSDPVKMGWMVGAPPPADKLIQFSNGSHFAFPQTRWSFANFQRFLPTSNVWRGDSAASPLPRAERSDIDAVSFQPLGRSGTMTWVESLAANYTDAIVVLHKGKIVYERYFGVMNPHATHIAMSVTKSFFGTLGAVLVAEGKLDEKAPVSKYIPELKETAYGDATVRQVLDMTVGVKYSENYADPKAEIFDHVRAGGLVPRPPGYAGPTSFYGFLKTLQKEGQHGEAFAYKTVNSDVLGWLIRRASGKTVGELLSERIWQKLGMEQDAYLLIDSEGTEFAGGGLNAAVRDLARFGEMMRLDGTYNGQQIIPKAVVDDIRNGGKKSDFEKAGYKTLPGWSYRDMWWVTHNEHGAFMARGVNGQSIYIDPKAEMVIARFGSHPMAANAHNDPTTLPAFHALAKHLMQ
jgi:CubicO group peptidase (beta-lactamase class C family)